MRVFSLISHSVSLINPMPALQGAAQLLPLIRIVCVCHRLWEPSESSKIATSALLAAINVSLKSFICANFGRFACQVVQWLLDGGYNHRSGKHEIRFAQACYFFFRFARSTCTVFIWRYRYSGSHQLKMRRRITSVAYRLWRFPNKAGFLSKFRTVMGPTYSWLFC